ncbi:hypothetical protein GCM10011317_07210 [Niveispirillum cyanobacteriorum]|nr:hypothetical protein GCM10011317_07210 [Niveispirillum cyanobacteriorum]
MRATFEVTFDVADFVEAGSHEVFLREVRDSLATRFDEVEFSIRERRPRAERLNEISGSPPRVSTGRVKRYAS